MNIKARYSSVLTILVLLSFLGWSCEKKERINSETIDENPKKLSIKERVSKLKAGDTLSLEDGRYEDIKLTIEVSGTKENPIVIKAKNPGEVIFCGDAKVEIIGDHITLEGIFFKDGNRNLEEWKSHGPGLVAIYGDHCRVTQCAFHCFDQANSAYITTSVREDGSFAKYCRIDHCSFTEKITFDQVINLNNTPKADKTPGAKAAEPMYHRIDHCLFSNPRKPGNAGGGIRVGYWRKDFGRCLIDSCLFARQDSEPEIVTSKSMENVYYANTMLNCQGTLNFRHGDNQVAINNFFISNDQMYDYGGMFVWGSGHLIASNYFELSTTLKARGNAALYLNPGGEACEHALAFDIDIANNIFSNNNGYDIHFYPLEERRIDYCKEKGYEYKVPYNLDFTGNIFHHPVSKYSVMNEKNVQEGRNITWKQNFVDSNDLGISPVQGIKTVAQTVVEGNGFDTPAKEISYPTKTSTRIKNIEGIDLHLEQRANVGIIGKPLTVKDVGPNWMKTVPGTYFHTGKLTNEVQRLFDEVTSQRK